MKFFAGPTMVARPLQNSLKIFSMDFTIQCSNLCEFIEKE